MGERLENILSVGPIRVQLTDFTVTHCPSAEEALSLLAKRNDFRALVITLEETRSFVLAVLALLPEAIVLCLLNDESAQELPPSERLYCLPTTCKERTISSVINLAFRAEESARQRDIDRFCSLGLGLKSIGRLGSLQDQLSLQLALLADTLGVDGARLFIGDSAEELTLVHTIGKPCEECEERCCEKWAKEAITSVEPIRHLSEDETRRILSLPLVVSGRIHGAIVLLRREPKGVFGERDVAMGRTFCTSLALAVQQNNALVEQEKSWTQLVLRISSLARLDKQASLAQLASRIYQQTSYSLRVITKLLDLMVLKEESEEQRNNLVVLKGETRSIRDTLDEHLQHLPSQHLSLKELSLNRLVDGALSLVKLTVDMTNVELRRHYASATNILTGRESELQLLAVNLILRAIDELGGTGELELRTEARDEDLSLIVAWWRMDERLVEEKKNIDKTLGMGVVTSIVERYSGKLIVAPREKKSGSYEVVLPKNKAAESQAVQRHHDHRRGDIRASLRVLVVDDEKDILFYFRALLENRVQTIVTASDINEALETLKREPFDVMFLDSRMPDTGGISFFKDVLRKDFPDLPVILFTGSEDPRDPYILDAGFYGVLVKPCRGREIFSALEQILRERRTGIANQSFSKIS